VPVGVTDDEYWTLPVGTGILVLVWVEIWYRNTLSACAIGVYRSQVAKSPLTWPGESSLPGLPICSSRIRVSAVFVSCRMTRPFTG